MSDNTEKTLQTTTFLILVLACIPILEFLLVRFLVRGPADYEMLNDIEMASLAAHAVVIAFAASILMRMRTARQLANAAAPPSNPTEETR